MQQVVEHYVNAIVHLVNTLSQSAHSTASSLATSPLHSLPLHSSAPSALQVDSTSTSADPSCANPLTASATSSAHENPNKWRVLALHSPAAEPLGSLHTEQLTLLHEAASSSGALAGQNAALHDQRLAPPRAVILLTSLSRPLYVSLLFEALFFCVS